MMMHTLDRRLFTSALVVALIAGVSGAQAPAEKIDTELIAKIRAEGMERSKILWIEHYLTDVYGPRPTGSPNHTAAANWAVKTMTSWGMTNAHLEPFTWRGVGWLPKRATGFITSPVQANLKFEAAPWSPSTKGIVAGQVLSLVPPQNPTEAEFTAFLVDIAPKVKGAIVMIGAPPNVPVNFNEPQKRQPDEQVKAQYGPADPNAPGRGRGGRGRGDTPTAEGRLSANQVSQRMTTFLRDNPPALRLISQGTGRIPGVIVAQNSTGQIYDETTPQFPAVILRYEDYGRIFRIIQDGTPVSVEFNVQNEFYPAGKTSYVTIGEIAGSDKVDEVVMLGGHLDSWTSATGATDNAIGCAIMLEAARILTVVGATPRRTIRVALWSGEEQGLLGSNDYVKRHFGSAEEPTADFNKLSAYWNIDDGTGKVRGASIFGPPEAAAALAQFLKPFEDWGVYGASSSTSRQSGGSDHGAFRVAGLPGISADQDPIEYNSTTWHTNLDTYERVVPDDVMKNAVITAAVVLHLANRDAILPRFSAAQMPAVSAGRGGGGRGASNAGPTADPRVFVTPKARPLTIPAPGLLPPAAANSAPATRAVALGAAASHGKVGLKSNGSFVYTPDASFVGTDSFTYTLTVGTATSAPGTVTIVVR